MQRLPTFQSVLWQCCMPISCSNESCHKKTMKGQDSRSWQRKVDSFVHPRFRHDFTFGAFGFIWFHPMFWGLTPLHLWAAFSFNGDIARLLIGNQAHVDRHASPLAQILHTKQNYLLRFGSRHAQIVTSILQVYNYCQVRSTIQCRISIIWLEVVKVVQYELYYGVYLRWHVSALLCFEVKVWHLWWWAVARATSMLVAFYWRWLGVPPEPGNCGKTHMFLYVLVIYQS